LGDKEEEKVEEKDKVQSEPDEISDKKTPKKETEELPWYFRKLIKQKNKLSDLTAEEKEHYLAALKDNKFHYIVTVPTIYMSQSVHFSEFPLFFSLCIRYKI